MVFAGLELALAALQIGQEDRRRSRSRIREVALFLADVFQVFFSRVNRIVELAQLAFGQAGGSAHHVVAEIGDGLFGVAG